MPGQSSHTPASPLALPLPDTRHATLGLILVRRMAVHGPLDSRASMLAMDAAGPHFRKLLVLGRAFLVDLGRTSARTIHLAPCCATGMTRDEGLIIELMENGGLDVLAALTNDAKSCAARDTALAFGRELRALACRRGWKS